MTLLTGNSEFQLPGSNGMHRKYLCLLLVANWDWAAKQYQLAKKLCRAECSCDSSLAPFFHFVAEIEQYYSHILPQLTA